MTHSIPAAQPAFSLPRLFVSAMVALLVTSLGLGVALASHQIPTWKAKDAKGRTVNTSAMAGKVQIITISNPDYKYKKATDKALQVIAGNFGSADDVGQLTLVDLRGMNWAKYQAADVSGELEKRMVKAHDRIAKRIAKALGKEGDAAAKSKIDKGLHLIPLREDKIIHHYKPWTSDTTENNLILVVVDKSGKFNKFWKIKKGTGEAAIDKTLAELKSTVEGLR